MQTAINWLLVAIAGGVLWIAESTVSRPPHFQSLAYFPSGGYAIGAALVIFVTLPSSILAVLYGICRRKKNLPMALVVILLGSGIFVFSASVALKFSVLFR